jgi:hypothetical protein
MRNTHDHQQQIAQVHSRMNDPSLMECRDSLHTEQHLSSAAQRDMTLTSETWASKKEEIMPWALKGNSKDNVILLSKEM